LSSSLKTEKKRQDENEAVFVLLEDVGQKNCSVIIETLFMRTFASPQLPHYTHTSGPSNTACFGISTLQ
jgi:hypothetical protein